MGAFCDGKIRNLEKYEFGLVAELPETNAGGLLRRPGARTEKGRRKDNTVFGPQH